jgi:16S rRNA G966 N2-methylase RsmD
MINRFLIQPSADPLYDPRLFLYDTQQIFKTPFCVDFTTRAIQTRIKKNKKNPEPLIRACGLHLKNSNFNSDSDSDSNLTLLDLTAGFGLDSFLLASFCPILKLTLLENNPVIHSLLTAGLKHAELFYPKITTRCHLVPIDHESYLKQLNFKYDIIYLDPMFPIRNKSARVKKYAELLQILTESHQLNTQTDLSTILALARAHAKKRVILKRPKTAPILDTPAFSLLGARGQSCRFDVY